MTYGEVTIDRPYSKETCLISADCVTTETVLFKEGPVHGRPQAWARRGTCHSGNVVQTS